MPAKPATVAEYLAALPADRRAVVESVRDVFLANLDAYEEGIQYGMIGYYVPHRIYPAGYHTDPKQPLPFGGIAARSGAVSIHLVGLYVAGEDSELGHWFRKAWSDTGRKLDMGKGCVRVKKPADVALDVLGELLRKLPTKEYLARYEAALRARESAAKPAKKRSSR